MIRCPTRVSVTISLTFETGIREGIKFRWVNVTGLKGEVGV